MSEQTAENDARCRLGYIEYDGAQYCFEHGGFLEPGVRSRMCDRAPRPLPLRRDRGNEKRLPACIRCGAQAIYDPQGGRYVHEDPAVSLAVDHAARVFPPGAS